MDTVDFASLVYFKVCSTVEAKLITLLDVVLKICRENI